MSSFGQIEYDAHLMIFSTRKELLECEVVELVYKFDNKSYHECLKRRVDR